MGLSASKPPSHPTGPVKHLKTRGSTGKRHVAMIRSYRTQTEKKMALDMLERVIDHDDLHCDRLVPVLLGDLDRNVDQGHPERELVILTSRSNPEAIAGYMYLEHRRRSVYIHLLEACFQKKGIGSILLDYAIDTATDTGKSYIELVSVTDPATIRFYESKGFLRGPHGTKKLTLPTQWNSVDYSDVDQNEKKEALPKLHLPIA